MFSHNSIFIASTCLEISSFQNPMKGTLKKRKSIRKCLQNPIILHFIVEQDIFVTKPVLELLKCNMIFYITRDVHLIIMAFHSVKVITRSILLKYRSSVQYLFCPRQLCLHRFLQEKHMSGFKNRTDSFQLICSQNTKQVLFYKENIC